MDYTTFLDLAKKKIHEVEYGPIVDEFDTLTELKKIITARQKSILYKKKIKQNETKVQLQQNG